MSDREILYGVTTILPDGTRATFQVTERSRPRWVRRDRGRGYMSSTRVDYTKKPRMYVSCGESVLENLMNRTSRPVTVWGRAIRQAMKQLELEGTIGWYAKAGCSCPCSPGFIWTNAPRLFSSDGYAHANYDVWVSLEGVPTVRTDLEAENERAHRLAQLAGDPTLSVDALSAMALL